MKKRHLWILIISILILSFSAGHYLKIDTDMQNIIKKDEIDDKVEEIETTGNILVTGDIMFHSPQIKSAYNSNVGEHDFKPVFKYVKKYIDSADLSIGNFETVTAGDERGYAGFPMFNSPESTLIALKDAGFDILTTANNHCLDQRKEGLIKTIDAIEKNGMKNIGTYKEPNSEILIENVNDIELALLSYTYGFNGMEGSLTEEEQSYMVCKIDEDRIKEDIKKAKDLEADMVIVFIHWGEEYHREPSEEQIALGEKMVDWGANIIIGSHPHVIQRSETINKHGEDNFIIYSMGNYISNQSKASLDNRYTEDGIMIEFKLKKDLQEGETIIEDVKYIPTWVRIYNEENKRNYEILPVEDFLNNEELKSKLNSNVILRIRESFEDTMEKMTQF